MLMRLAAPPTWISTGSLRIFLASDSTWRGKVALNMTVWRSGRMFCRGVGREAGEGAYQQQLPRISDARGQQLSTPGRHGGYTAWT